MALHGWVVLLAAGAAAWLWLGVGPGGAAPDPPRPPIEEAFRKEVSAPQVANLVWVAGVDLDAPAGRLAAAYGPGAAAFLKDRLTNGRPPEAYLAAVALAKLADDADVTKYLLGNPKALPRPVSYLVAFFPPKARGAALGELLRGSPEPWAVYLAGVAGGADDLPRLDAIEKTAAAGSPLPAQARSAAAEIRRRLARPTAAEREAWVAGGLSLWKVQYDARPDMHNPETLPWTYADKLHRAGLTVPASFLKAHLGASGYDSELLVAVAGTQREQGLVDDLLDLAKASHRTGLSAQRALGMIGADKALRGIEAMLTPAEGREKVHDNIARVLIGHGDAKSLAVLERVKENTKFTPTDLITFDDAHRRLQRRLEEEAKKKRPSPE